MTKHAGDETGASKGAESAPLPDFATSRELIGRARQGDREAINRLFERYYDRVYRIVRIRMGARLRNALESVDIVQNTFAKAAEKLAGFQPHDHAALINWLAAIAQHQIHDARDRVEAERRNPDREVPLDPGEENHASDDPSPSTIVGNSELREIYDACVEALPEPYRELILQREYAGSSWEDVCERIGTPSEGAARAMYKRAQIKLAGLLRRRIRT
jgi:RNA polymerase sigma-70 factor (ECF subfamily)